jgi:hypothetical protein
VEKQKNFGAHSMRAFGKGSLLKRSRDGAETAQFEFHASEIVSKAFLVKAGSAIADL